MINTQRYFKPNFKKILFKSLSVFFLSLIIFSWEFTEEYSPTSIIFLSIIFVISVLVILIRIQYITINDDHIVIENGIRMILNRPLKIYFDKIYSLNYLNSFLIHVGNMIHLEFTYYSSEKNQSMFSTFVWSCFLRFFRGSRFVVVVLLLWFPLFYS